MPLGNENLVGRAPDSSAEGVRRHGLLGGVMLPPQGRHIEGVPHELGHAVRTKPGKDFLR